jgi:hypothetical protein
MSMEIEISKIEIVLIQKIFFKTTIFIIRWEDLNKCLLKLNYVIVCWTR